jgi:hypothetical protein
MTRYLHDGKMVREAFWKRSEKPAETCDENERLRKAIEIRLREHVGNGERKRARHATTGPRQSSAD